MFARLSLRFLLVLLISAAAIFALVTMFEAMIRAPLSFGTATVIVVSLLVAARSCGSLWVCRNNTVAGIRPVVGYGLWFALLSLALLAAGATGMRGLLADDFSGSMTSELRYLVAVRPVSALILLALGFATTAVVTCTGFALGSRAQARLLSPR